MNCYGKNGNKNYVKIYDIRLMADGEHRTVILNLENLLEARQISEKICLTYYNGINKIYYCDSEKDAKELLEQIWEAI